MRNKFTKSAQKALDNSLSVAKSFGHGYIGTEHLLIALVKTKGVAAEVMRENGVEEEKLRVIIEEMIETGEERWQKDRNIHQEPERLLKTA